MYDEVVAAIKDCANKTRTIEDINRVLEVLKPYYLELTVLYLSQIQPKTLIGELND